MGPSGAPRRLGGGKVSEAWTMELGSTSSAPVLPSRPPVDLRSPTFKLPPSQQSTHKPTDSVTSDVGDGHLSPIAAKSPEEAAVPQERPKYVQSCTEWIYVLGNTVRTTRSQAPWVWIREARDGGFEKPMIVEINSTEFTSCFRFLKPWTLLTDLTRAFCCR